MLKPDDMGQIVDGDTLRFVRFVSHAPERVWRAITDEGELQAWMRYPVSFEPREGGAVRFFGDGQIEGIVFILDPPRTLAFSFWDARAENASRIALEWTVRWEIEPEGGGSRITFTHRRLGGAHLWGLGEGWHGFLDQLTAYLDGALGEVIANRARLGGEAYTGGLTAYRAHVSRELLEWAQDAARRAKRAAEANDQPASLAAIQQLEKAAHQLFEIARQDGPRPDYAPDPPPAPN